MCEDNLGLQQVMMLTAAINVVAEQNCPMTISKTKGFHTKWLNDDLRGKIKTRDQLFDKFKKYKKQGLNDLAQVTFKEYKKIRNKISHEISKAKRENNKEI